MGILRGKNFSLAVNFKPSKKLPDNKATFYALITVLCWSTVATAFKIGLDKLAPAQLLLIASLTTLVLLFIYLVASKKTKLLKEITTKHLLFCALLGFLNPFLYYLVLFKGYSLLPAQVAQPLNMVWPIVLVLLSVPILGKKIGWKSLIALLISFCGVLLISSQGKFFNLGDSNPLGVILCLASSVIWSLFWILNVKNKEDETIKLFLNFLFGTIFLIIYIAIFSEFPTTFNKSAKAGIYIGFFELAIPFVLWIKALTIAKNQAHIANLTYISPFLSLLFIHFILGEKIFVTTMLGLLFIISGILFQKTDKQ